MLSFLPPKVPMVELVGRPEAEMDPLSAIFNAAGGAVSVEGFQWEEELVR